MIKRAYQVPLSYPISDQEIFKANSLLTYLDYSKKSLTEASKYLDTIFVPFKNSKESDAKVTSDQLLKSRAYLRKFRDTVIDKFNKFKQNAVYAFSIFEYFSSDSQVLGLMNSLSNSIDALEKKVNNFSSLFNNLDSAEFVDNVLKIIGDDSDESKNKDSIKKDCEVINNLIEDRIQQHISKNILGKDWRDAVSKKLKIIPQKRSPLIRELNNKG